MGLFSFFYDDSEDIVGIGNFADPFEDISLPVGPEEAFSCTKETDHGTVSFKHEGAGQHFSVSLENDAFELELDNSGGASAKWNLGQSFRDTVFGKVMWSLSVATGSNDEVVEGAFKSGPMTASVALDGSFTPQEGLRLSGDGTTGLAVKVGPARVGVQTNLRGSVDDYTVGALLESERWRAACMYFGKAAGGSDDKVVGLDSESVHSGSEGSDGPSGPVLELSLHADVAEATDAGLKAIIPQENPKENYEVMTSVGMPFFASRIPDGHLRVSASSNRAVGCSLAFTLQQYHLTLSANKESLLEPTKFGFAVGL